MLTIKQMKALEREAQKKGIFPIDLMENAGKEVAKVVREKYDPKHIAIFCGNGNNGGDGFVAARYFAENSSVIVFFFGDEENLTEEAKENYDKIKDNTPIINIQSKEDLKKFHFQKLSLILIDAMLGTGFKEPIREPISLGIDLFNSTKAIKVAIDVPSGINPDTGEHQIICNSDLIICLHDIKTGLEKLQEKCVVVDIGIPY
jgi:ADP-dependent NAD(P)H-hydrate dehydratase / NAD(P)H-hydrate epimerase